MRPPPQPVPALSQAPARPQRQPEDDKEQSLEAAETAAATTSGSLGGSSTTAQPAPQPQDVAMPELAAPKPRGRQDSGASQATKAEPSTAGAHVLGSDAAADEQSLAEVRQAEPSRITAAPGEVAVTAEAIRPSKPSEPVLDAVQEQQQAGVPEQALPAAAPLSKPVPLPVPQQLGKPRTRAVPEQASQPPTARPTDSVSISTSTGSTPSTLVPLPVSPETQSTDYAAAVSLEAGTSTQGLTEKSPAASDSLAATGVEEAAVTTPELAAAENIAAEQGAEEPGSTGQPLVPPDIPKPLAKPAQLPAKRPAPALQASQVIIFYSNCCKGDFGPLQAVGFQCCLARATCECRPAFALVAYPHLLHLSL